MKIKHIKVKEKPCDLYDPKNKKLFTIKSDLELNEVRIQIKDQKLSGYYIIFEGDNCQKIRIDINDKGNLSAWPNGFFDISEKQLYYLIYGVEL